MKKWTKNININDARKLSRKFCKDFNIEYCRVNYVDNLDDPRTFGEYHFDEKRIEIIKNGVNKIGILMHELTHHIQNLIYTYNSQKDQFHGYYYQLAKKRVITWCKKNISNKTDWSIPLSAYINNDKMKKCKL